MQRQLYVYALALLLMTVVPSVAAAQPPAAPATPSPTQPVSSPQPAPSSQTADATGSSGTPTFEVGLGYQFLRAGGLCFDDDTDGDDECGDAQSYPLGFAIDGVRNFGRVGLLGELGWSRDSQDFSAGTDSGSVSENLFHYAAGVRFTGHGAGRFWPYGQVLVGGVTSRVSADFDDGSDGDDAVSRTRFMVQPGIGATIVGGDGWGVFGQVDYRRIFLKEDEDGSSGRNDIRVFLGLRVILD